MSLRAVYLTLSRFLATVRCGHSYASVYHQRREVAAALFEAPERLPFDLVWHGDAMIVTADPFATGIARGSRIIAIDGRPAGAVLAALMPFARGDGYDDAKRRRPLSVQGDDRHETVNIFSLLFGRERYRLIVEDPAGRRRGDIAVPIPRADIAAGTDGQLHRALACTRRWFAQGNRDEPASELRTGRGAVGVAARLSGRQGCRATHAGR